MQKIKKALSIILAVVLFISLLGCNVAGNDKYRVVERLEDQQFCVGFRKDDKSGEFVIAAMAVLQNDGTISKISQKWFGEDISLLKGDPDALNELKKDLQKRTFIIGYDSGRLPFSGADNAGRPTGFDVEVAKAVCDKLGWKTKFIPIDVSKADVELNSGNVDCVWGALAYDAANTGINQSPVYAENTIIIASLAGSKVRSMRSLNNKTLAISDNGYYNKLLTDNPSLENKPGYIIRVPGGAADCFKALNGGECDAIITDRAAIDYYK